MSSPINGGQNLKSDGFRTVLRTSYMHGPLAAASWAASPPPPPEGGGGGGGPGGGGGAPTVTAGAAGAGAGGGGGGSGPWRSNAIACVTTGNLEKAPPRFCEIG